MYLMLHTAEFPPLSKLVLTHVFLVCKTGIRGQGIPILYPTTFIIHSGLFPKRDKCTVLWSHSPNISSVIMIVLQCPTKLDGFVVVHILTAVQSEGWEQCKIARRSETSGRT